MNILQIYIFLTLQFETQIELNIYIVFCVNVLCVLTIFFFGKLLFNYLYVEFFFVLDLFKILHIFIVIVYLNRVISTINLNFQQQYFFPGQQEYFIIYYFRAHGNVRVCAYLDNTLSSDKFGILIFHKHIQIWYAIPNSRS